MKTLKYAFLALVLFVSNNSFADGFETKTSETTAPNHVNILSEQISSIIKYPEYAKKNNIEGFVVISFSYNSEGSLVINDYNTSNTELSTYVISEMQKLQVCPWGKNPNNEYLVKINFTLL